MLTERRSLALTGSSVIEVEENGRFKVCFFLAISRSCDHPTNWGRFGAIEPLWEFQIGISLRDLGTHVW